MLSARLDRNIVNRVAATVGASLALLAVSALFSHPALAEPEELTACSENQLIEYGDVVECTIETAGDQDVFRFSGSTGNVVVLSLLDMVSGCGNSYGTIYSCPYAALYEPGNNTTPIETLGCGNAWKDDLELPSSGTYTLLVSECGNDQTTPYRIGLERLFPTSPTAMDLPWNDVVVDETIDPKPDQDFYTFRARKDAVVTLSIADRTSGCGNSYGTIYPCPYAILYGPGETELASLGAGTDSENVALPEDGKYTVHVVESGNDQNETYNIGLQCLFPPAGFDTCELPRGGCPPDDPCDCQTCNGLEPTICGTNGLDTLFGTSGPDVIHGLNGNDIIYGLAGDDVICGGDGFDSLFGNQGNDQLFGYADDDVLFGDPGDDLLVGGKGRDMLFGGEGEDTLIGQKGFDVLVGGADADVLDGNDGFDICDDEDDTVASSNCERLRNP